MTVPPPILDDEGYAPGVCDVCGTRGLIKFFVDAQCWLDRVCRAAGKVRVRK